MDSPVVAVTLAGAGGCAATAMKLATIARARMAVADGAMVARARAARPRGR
jgi:hypothetical protein